MPRRPKPKPFRLSRKPHRVSTKAVRNYAIHTGEVIWAWNQLHYRLQWVFIKLFWDRIEAANAMWHSVRTDGGQRDLLRAAAQQLLPEESAISNAVTWLLDVVALLVPHRNAATHVPTEPLSRYAIIQPLAPDAGAKRLQAPPNLARFHRLLRDDLYALTHYAMAIQFELGGNNVRSPLPTPPELRSIPKGNVPTFGVRKRKQI